jgi:uncharacterized integral membrane protein
MNIVRTIVWVLLLVALLIFSANNWNPVEVKIWEGLVLETKIPALVVIAFLVGLVPMWLLHRANRWNNERRIASLESAARASAMAAAPPPPAHPVEPLREEPRVDLTPTDEPNPTP